MNRKRFGIGRLAQRGIGVRGRLFGALAVTGLLALGIGLAAHGAFNRLHEGITEVTAERFPAVVASARLERQHQRIMRTLRELAAATDNLERETVDQGLSDQLAGYERLLAELPSREGHDAQQVANLRAQYLEMVRLRDAIDARVNERAAAGRAVRDLDRAAARLNDALNEPPLNGAAATTPTLAPTLAAWREPVRRALFLIASAHRVENRFALTRLAGEAADALVIARGALPGLPDAPPSVRKAADEVTRGLARLVTGEESVFAHRGRQLEAAGGLGGLLERANQVSLLITGLTSGIFVEQTRLAEESRHDLLVISDTHTRLFLAASLVVALVGALSLAYVQRSIVARLWAVRDALRRRAEGDARAIPVEGADEIGELARALSFHINQTEEKNEALRRNESWLRATLEAAPVPLAIARLDDGVMRFVNRRAAELLGTEDGESFVGRSIAGLWRSVIVWEGFVDEIVKHAVAVDLEAELLTASGERFWGLVSGTLIEFEGEQVLLVALVDITRRRRAESLARRTQRELREAKERAERADATKTEFLATLSHEMRTPLNGILGLGRVLLTAAALGDAERRHVGSIMRCGGTLLDQVNDILDLRKIEDGKLDLDPIPCQLAAFLDDVLVAVAPMAEEKVIGLDLRVADDLPPAVVVDPQRLRQILVNLVGNAVKFTETGGVTVAVAREPTGAPPTEDDAGEWLVARVRDTGIGIPPERHAAIFEKLEQGDPSISRRFGGSGLGLAIARHLANAMGGDITVDSLPGLGSTFTLRVPLIVATESGETPGDGSAPLPTADGPLALLLVEDDQINREVAMGLLGAAGHTVTLATTGAAAVELATTRDFDAVLLDMRLPDIDGVEVAGRIRAAVASGRSGVPIIAVTANVFATDRLRYMEAGVDAIVEKPIFPERLTRTLSALTGATPPGSVPSGAIPSGPAPISERPPVDADLIDVSVLSRYHAALGPARFENIRALLIESAAEGLPRLADPQTPVAEIADIAHRLAGAGSHFGLRDFVARMRAVEDATRAGGGNDAAAMVAAALMTEAAAAFDRALAAMDDWRARLPTAGDGKAPVAPVSRTG